jgi:6-phosphogluconolactonase (cycloisomerase 2 family)
VAGSASAASAATTSSGDPGGASNVVFVQTDNTAGNQVVAYDRAAGGTLTLAHTYNTGGLGGKLTGAAVDDLASQGSLTYDPAHGLLYAVNAGSNTLTVFAARGDQLSRQQVISSHGTFPVSVAVHGDLVYVLDALNGGSVQGFAVADGRLRHIENSGRGLHLDPNATPQFTNTPGQVAFSPDGSQLIVTTKANGNHIDVFRVGGDGTLSDGVVNTEPAEVPFGVAFTPAGDLAVSESASTSAVATFALHPDGTITQLDQVDTTQAATCWIVADHASLFSSNAGSATVSRFTSNGAGHLTLLGQTSTDPGTVDAAVAPDGGFLYVQTGANGIVDEFSVDHGNLTKIGSVTVTGAAGGEGIAAA